MVGKKLVLEYDRFCMTVKLSWELNKQILLKCGSEIIKVAQPHRHFQCECKVDEQGIGMYYTKLYDEIVRLNGAAFCSPDPALYICICASVVA